MTQEASFDVDEWITVIYKHIEFTICKWRKGRGAVNKFRILVFVLTKGERLVPIMIKINQNFNMQKIENITCVN